MRFLPLALCLLVLPSCSGDKGPTEPDHANVAGTWDAVITVVGSTSEEYGATLTLAQSGTQLTGTWLLTQEGLGGEIIGTVAGQTVAFTVQQGQPCPGVFNGNGTVDSAGTTMSGSYSGSDSCVGALATQFSATKR